MTEENEALEARIVALEGASTGGLGAPDYDTGWVVQTRDTMKTFYPTNITNCHNVLVYMEGRYLGTVMLSSYYFAETMPEGMRKEGVYWQLYESTEGKEVLHVFRTANDLSFDEIRVRIWQLP